MNSLLSETCPFTEGLTKGSRGVSSLRHVACPCQLPQPGTTVSEGPVKPELGHGLQESRHAPWLLPVSQHGPPSSLPVDP